MDDASTLVGIAGETDDLGAQTGFADLSSVPAARAFITSSLDNGDGHRNWAVSVGGVAVGNIGLSAIDPRHDTAWAYYWLAASARGRGYAVRGLVAACAWAFAQGTYRLELGHRVNNPASCRVATSAGFVVEGIEREKLRYGGERFDVELHARLRGDAEPEVTPLAMMCDPSDALRSPSSST